MVALPDFKQVFMNYQSRDCFTLLCSFHSCHLCLSASLPPGPARPSINLYHTKVHIHDPTSPALSSFKTTPVDSFLDLRKTLFQDGERPGHSQFLEVGPGSIGRGNRVEVEQMEGQRDGIGEDTVGGIP
jgi:hypothetical protein